MTRMVVVSRPLSSHDHPVFLFSQGNNFRNFNLVRCFFWHTNSLGCCTPLLARAMVAREWVPAEKHYSHGFPGRAFAARPKRAGHFTQCLRGDHIGTSTFSN